MKQLQYMGALVQFLQRRNGRVVKLTAAIGRRQRVVNLGNGEILQIASENLGSPLTVAHAGQRRQLFPGNAWKHGGHVQAAVGRKAVKDRLRGRDASAAAGGEK